MSINKLALIRYRTLDECLQNRYRKWTLDNLIEKVADALYELEGITSGVSKRTIQADIQVMRSNKLGYNAPIVVTGRKFYTYSDPEYTITRAPINKADMEKMREIVGFLKHFNGFSYFDEMSDMISRLENNLDRSEPRGRNVIQFENNRRLKGLEHITPLYNAILKKCPLLIEYKSFKAAESREQVCYPYLLKEHRNRWFLICGVRKSWDLTIMALDRVVGFQELKKESFIESNNINFDLYFADTIGVTRSERDKAVKVVLFVDKEQTPYVLTKPLHPSQQVLKEDDNGIEISIRVVLNFELEREILGFGQNMKVLAPRILVDRIRRRFKLAAAHYY